MAKTKTLKPIIVYLDAVTYARLDAECRAQKLSRREWFMRALHDRDTVREAARRIERELAEVVAHVY